MEIVVVNPRSDTSAMVTSAAGVAAAWAVTREVQGDQAAWVYSNKAAASGAVGGEMLVAVAAVETDGKTTLTAVISLAVAVTTGTRTVVAVATGEGGATAGVRMDVVAVAEVVAAAIEGATMNGTATVTATTTVENAWGQVETTTRTASEAAGDTVNINTHLR